MRAADDISAHQSICPLCTALRPKNFEGKVRFFEGDSLPGKMGRISMISMIKASIVVVLHDRRQFPLQLLDFLVDVFDVLAIALVLPFVVLPLVGLLVLVTQLVVDLRLLFTLLFQQHFLYARNQPRD